uniref:Kinesin-like protein n=1 Tax=Clytia hemisphaerica TaxID=252671 RepID=A0A7M5WW18_9CNID
MHLIDQVLMLNGNEAAVPIKVAIRVRPFVGEENYSQGESCLYCVPGKPHILVKSKNKEYQFDYVYDQNCSQNDVYSGCVTSLVDAFFTGYNGTVFAYGQTGSGKTYTMGIGSCVYLDEIQKGIVPRALNDIFRKKEALQQDVVCKLSVTFIEIYREETTDLLDNSCTLQIREDEKGTTVIVGAREETVDTLDDVFTLLDAGTALRHVGSTNMNEQSSRSHCIFTVKLEQYQFGEEQGMEGKCLCSSLHFVDLAGSERAHRTGNQGTRFKESVSINTGLLALGNVISALTDTKRKKRHVPYRESKLTRLLKNSLGGNSRTVMITCLSPTDADLDEVINSVSYASRAQKIFNQPVVNWNREKSQIDGMRKEINNLRSELQRRRSGDPRDRNYHENDEVNSRVDHLTMEHEKRDQKEATLFNILHEVNAIIHAIQSTHPPLSSQLNLQIESWRDKWKDKSQSNRPLSAPSSIIKMSHEITEQLQNELLHYKERDMENNVMIEKKSNEVDELRQEVIAFGEENAKLRLDLDIAINTTRDFQERLFEQQMAIKHFQNKQPGSHPSTATVTTLPSDNYSTTRGGVRPRPNRMVERFRVKNDLLVSEIDEMDWVEHDEVGICS